MGKKDFAIALQMTLVLSYVQIKLHVHIVVHVFFDLILVWLPWHLPSILWDMKLLPSAGVGRQREKEGGGGDQSDYETLGVL